MFDRAKQLHASGKTFGDIAQELGIGRRTIAKWIKTDVLPHRRRNEPKPSSPFYFYDFLACRWAEGDRVGRRLFHEIKRRGYAGSFSHLERLLSAWRRTGRSETHQWKESVEEVCPIDPATGWQISPVAAAALCMKPTPMLTSAQAAKVAALKQASPSFVVMRRLAMRFRGLLHGANAKKLTQWLDDARRSGIRTMRQFTRTLSRDLDAIKNAITYRWSSGQAEGQINRLKALKRAMYGRASVELLPARITDIDYPLARISSITANGVHCSSPTVLSKATNRVSVCKSA